MRFDFEPLKEGDVVHHAERIRWTEESFLDVPRRYDAAPSSFLGVFQGGYRVRILLIALLAVFTIFLVRVLYLQLFEGDTYAALSERNRIRTVIERAARGIIVDRRQRPIVVNEPEFILTITPAELPSDETTRRALLVKISSLLHEPLLTLTEEISALPRDLFIRRQALPFRDQIDYTDALRFMVEINQLPGFRVEVRERRSYPETYVSRTEPYTIPQSIAHVIGYLGKIGIDELSARQQEGYLASDLVGKDGVERFYDRRLHGVHGKRYVEIDALGEEKFSLRREESKPGERLVLSIDLDVQRAAEEAITRVMASLPKRYRKGAAAIALDPRSGAIRALVSLPVYSPRIFSGKTPADDITKLFNNPDRPLFARAVAGEYPSGSTIKPLFALAALAEGVITPTTSVSSVGGISVGPWFFPDWKEGGHGATDVRKAIAESVNTFFYTIGGGNGSFVGLGIDRMAQWLQNLNFGKPLGIDLPHEGKGLIPTPEWKKFVREERWYIGDTYHLAIGQGDILVTPLQIAAMTSVFANGGTLWKPSLVVQKEPQVLVEQIGSPALVQVVREGMRRTVTGGSAQSLQLLSVAAAGKTGTAEWSSKRKPHAWFTGFAPYNDPELVVTVLVEEGGEGSAVAVPIAREIFQKYFRD